MSHSESGQCEVLSPRESGPSEELSLCESCDDIVSENTAEIILESSENIELATRGISRNKDISSRDEIPINAGSRFQIWLKLKEALL